MANLVINEQLLARLQQLAARQNRPIEAILDEMLTQFEDDPPLKSRTAYMAKLYAYARAYWQRVNDTERLLLTDEQLDEQFWCIDPEGIPRLKSDRDEFHLPDNSAYTLLETIWQDNPAGETEEPINYRDILNKDFPAYLIHRMQGNNAQSNTD
ncbi:MAG: hypothetical protein KF716_22350 [Anaerolineae bacterium]|nr:hypothetical protein [Anaerolineae bacterium]